MQIDSFFDFLSSGSNTPKPSFKEYRKFFPKMIRQLAAESSNSAVNYFFYGKNDIKYSDSTYAPILMVGNKNNFNLKTPEDFFTGYCWIENGNLNLYINELGDNPDDQIQKERISKNIGIYLFQFGRVLFNRKTNVSYSTTLGVITDKTDQAWDESGGHPEINTTVKSNDNTGVVKIVSIDNTNKETYTLKDFSSITIDRTIFEIKGSFLFSTSEYVWARMNNGGFGFIKSDSICNWKTEFHELTTILQNQYQPNINKYEKCIEEIVTELEGKGPEHPAAIKYYDRWKKRFMKEVFPNILKRVAGDLPVLKENLLINNGDTLESVEFPLSDFHKDGQQVIFLIFKSGKKVVYKPSDLRFDKLLVGKKIAGENNNVKSFAEVIDPDGQLIPTYTIVPKQDNDGYYGYMQFITEEPPENRDDIVGICKSVAANMALSYFVGLDDIHQENILLKKNCVQLIDMEAVSGVSKLNSWIDDKLWPTTINDLSDKVKKAIPSNKREKLTTNEINQIIKDITNSVEKWTYRIDGSYALRKVNNISARFVPIKTSDFKAFAYAIAEENMDQVAFLKYAITEQNARGNGITQDILENILSPMAVYEGLMRMDIPYFYNKLGEKLDSENKITDDKGLSVPGVSKHVKLTNNIKGEIMSRYKDKMKSFIDKFNQAIPQYLNKFQTFKN